MVEDQPEGNIGFEKLNDLMRRMDAKNGQPPFLPDAAFINQRLDAMIAYLTAMVRMEHEARAGVIPGASADAKSAPP